MAGPVAAFTTMYNAGVIIIFFSSAIVQTNMTSPGQSEIELFSSYIEQDLQGVFYWTPSKMLSTEISLTGHPQKS